MSHFVRHDCFIVIPRSTSDEGSPPLNRGGELTLLELHPKHKRRRFFLAKVARQNDYLAVTPNAVRGLLFYSFFCIILYEAEILLCLYLIKQV